MAKVTVNFPDGFLPEIESFASECNMPVEKAVVLLTRSALEQTMSADPPELKEELWPTEVELKKAGKKGESKTGKSSNF